MSFTSKLGQIMDIITGGFQLNDDDQRAVNDLSSILCNYADLTLEEKNGALFIFDNIITAFSHIPEGRSVKAKTLRDGILTLQKIDGVVQIVDVEKTRY